MNSYRIIFFIRHKYSNFRESHSLLTLILRVKICVITPTQRGNISKNNLKYPQNVRIINERVLDRKRKRRRPSINFERRYINYCEEKKLGGCIIVFYKGKKLFWLQERHRSSGVLRIANKSSEMSNMDERYGIVDNNFQWIE